ncbi:uncharacterized protein EDB91DRAFT_1314974 [Suillus paluster]|uniref:uncharacterized protein n=1 Tax=Suillus paluster TaxID=48578 RepID=UPI001B873BD3|nr:uncharacterized protein EDB91DRAFT_1314974 [Suillus paluster]KAG1748342.1 hypothetical protein EDB91DRAFT_1314974 [Suillus paluster]
MRRKTGLLSLPEELRSYILSFLPWRDILRCTSLCKALRQTYMSSSELQYITELGGQQLLPVSNNYICVSKRLQLLRDKAYAWFKFDIERSFKTISIQKQFYETTKTFIADGHACFWNPFIESVKIFPILPKPSQQTIERDFSPGSLCSVPNQNNIDIYMDPAQNLLAIVYAIRDDSFPSDEKFYIDLVTLDGDGTHPQAAGRTLFLSELCLPDNFLTQSLKLAVFGRHIAFRRTLPLFDETDEPLFKSIWWLQIWDWQHSTTSNSVLSSPITNQDSYYPMDFCFLGNDRFLIVSDSLKLYSIEDMSREPQLLASFMLPVSTMDIRCFTPTNDIARSSYPQIQAMWTSDPKNRLLALVIPSSLDFVVSTRIFFEPDFQGITVPIPWEDWGPSNTRVFPHEFPCRLGVSGNRALYAFPAAGAALDAFDIAAEYRLHLMDFSPLAVKHYQQGLGRLVNEPSTVETSQSRQTLTTSLPYVEFVSNRGFSYGEVIEIWLDKDKIYLFKENIDTNKLDELEVIEI